jgi:hypothetical protein
MNDFQLPISLEAIAEKKLKELATKRQGGVYNIRGINYQILYSIKRLLEDFAGDATVEHRFSLEGIEDLDCVTQSENGTIRQFVQLKCKNENLKYADFTSQILPNFLETFDVEQSVSFLIVSNVHVTGRLQDLVNANKGIKTLTDGTKQDLYEKIRELRKNYSIEQIDFFLSKIHFQRCLERDLYDTTLALLIDKYGVVNGKEARFFQALFYAVSDWSEDKKTVEKQDINQIIQAVSDDVGGNQAIHGGWIKSINFAQRGDTITDNSYFEGKAAKPFHIAALLPIERPKWEKEILESIAKFDVTLIKASSGQGKSTLAWRTAMALSKQGFSVFELTEIGEKGIQDVFLFIESRLKLGIVPLIVIDGLNDDLKDWYKVTQKVQILRGVKFLITSREEDWFRFGNGASTLNLKPINIDLEANEAKGIFAVFQKKGKIHSNIGRDWQIAWEKVSQSKLLIEYVYLLTQGQMIHDRMAEQLNAFRDNRNEASIKGILRMVAVADVLHIKLPTEQVLTFAENKFGFQGDQATVLKSLKDEYQIQTEDCTYIEGLHPVRSAQISKILHDGYPLSITLIQLLSVIEPQSLFTFVANAPLLLEKEVSKKAFLEKLAEVMAEKSYADMVNAIVGVFATDAHEHWLENREVYDRLSTQGLMLYAILKTPFSGLSVSDFGIFSEHNPQFDSNLVSIKEIKIEESYTFLFLNALQKALKDKPIKRDWKKITQLERWFHRVGLESKILRGVSFEDLEHFFESLPADDLGEILYGLYLLDLPIYRVFIKHYQQRLINKLKIETQTLVIKTVGNNLEIRYIVDNQEHAHKQSVSRVKTIGYCLPHFETFDIMGIYFPNPIFRLLHSKYDDSHKSSDLKKWLKSDDFATKGNNIWVSQIERNYEFETHYEWQKYWVDYRHKMVDWMCQATRFVEARMSKIEKFNAESEKLAAITNSLIQFRHQMRSIRYDESFIKDYVKPDMDKFDKWKSPLENVFNQTFPDVKNNHAWHVYKLNIKNALNRLFTMQAVFDSICQKTANYFDTTDLKREELSVYTYFYNLMVFFYGEFHLKKRTVLNPRNEVKLWKTAEHKTFMQKLNDVKADFESFNPYELLLPKSILVESDYLDSVVLGIKGLKIEDFEDELQFLMQGLIGLSRIKAQFFYLVFIENESEAHRMSFRFNDGFLEELQEVLAGKRTEFENKPLPVELKAEIVAQLEGITISEKSADDPIKSAAFLLHEALWRYSETQKRISERETDLADWRKKTLRKIENTITEQLRLLKPNEILYAKYTAIAGQVLENSLDFDDQLCVQYWQEDVV